MKIVFLTPGTGSYYCGACMRDNALARELQQTGHDVTIAPLYLPLMIDDQSLAGLEQVPIFFGGINLYLQQKIPLFRRTPAAIDRLLNFRPLLRWAARHSHMTSAREHGEMTLEMLNITSSRFQKEWDKLLEWLEQSEKPDLVCLSNALLAGFATEMKRRLGVPVITFFQGEDSFLDGLPEPQRAQCWAALAQHAAAADVLVAPSRFYADLMRQRLNLPAGAIEVVPNGISLERYAPTSTRPTTPTIGYLARMTRDKGLELLVDAFIVLATQLGDRATRLGIAGAATAGDQPLIADLQARLTRAGLAARVDWHPNVSWEGKSAFLQGLALFTVPAIYAEAFGLYVVEAMACGVPVVQPASAAFPEILHDGGGRLFPPRDAAALAHAWRDLLADAGEREKLGRAARLSVEKHFNAGRMCAQFCQVADRLTRATA